MPSDPAYIRNFRVFASQTGKYRMEDLKRLNEELSSSNDRALVVLNTAMLETSLESFLKSHVRPGCNKDDMRILFDSSGILGSLGAKITSAYVFNWIGPETRHDLNLIRLLRNGFAHFPRPISLEDAPVAVVCEHLKSPTWARAIHPDGFYLRSEHRLKPRILFEAACFTLSDKFLSHVRPKGEKAHLP